MSIFKRNDRDAPRRTVPGPPDSATDQAPIPPGSLITTRTSTLAHIKSAVHPGACCEALSEWTDWRVAGEGAPICHRCDLAQLSERKASA